MDMVFKGIFDNALTQTIAVRDFLLCLGVSLLLGLVGAICAPRCYAVSDSATEVRARLEISKDTVTLTLTLDEGDAVCGFLAEIAYDSDSLTLVRVTPDGETDNGGHISYLDRGGRLRILADGYMECFRGRLFTVVFRIDGDAVAESGVSFTSLSLFRWCEGVSEERIDVESVRIPAERLDGETDGVKYADGAVTVVCFLDGFPFAAGLEVTAVDLRSPCVESFETVFFLRCGEAVLDATVLLPTRGRYCIILRPVSYFRDGAETGDGWIFILTDGVLFGDITEIRE